MSEGAREPQGGNTTARCVKRVLKGWREQGHGIGCRPGALLAVVRFRERPAMNAGQAWDMHYEKDLGTAASRGDGIAGSRPALQGQVTTATPFAPRWSGARMALGKP